MHVVKCLNCENEFSVTPSRYNNRDKFYCCKKCMNEHKKKNNPNYYRCEICGEMTYKKPSQIEKNNHITCSRECLGILKKTIFKGESNPNYGNRAKDNNLWSGDETVTSNGYIKVYKPDHPCSDKSGRILKHRLMAEQIATESQLEVIANKKVLRRDLDVHHIDFDKTNNGIDNLSILTKQVHAKIHGDVKKNRIYKTCMYCKKSYEVIKSRKTLSNYCSKECVSNDKDTRVEVICPICDETFLVNKKQSKERTCCSIECSNILRDRGKVSTRCDNCKKEFVLKKSVYDKSKNHFCCRECYYEYKRK